MAKITSKTKKNKPVDTRKIKINAEWEARMLRANRMVRPRTASDAILYDEHGRRYKICQCCGAIFYPTRGHDRDQLYCKQSECRRQRTNLRQRLYYKRKMLNELTRLAHCLRKKQEREHRKQRLGIEPPEKFGHRRRNSVRRMKADMDRKLEDLKICFSGMLVTFGYKTESDVSAAMKNFREKGQELRYSSPG